MAFSNYKNVGEVLKEFQVTYTEENFMGEAEFVIADYFREDLETVMREGVVYSSDFSICENLIYPVLKEVWKRYKTSFVIWSNHSLNYEENLSGFLEYNLVEKSSSGKVISDKPYLILLEAKQDNFEESWAQCLAEMIAARRLNAEIPITIFGIVSNGKIWQFGKLEEDNFTTNINIYTIQNLDKIFAVVNYIFQQCELQLKTLVTT
jgi:hypothetical protein